MESIDQAHHLTVARVVLLRPPQQAAQDEVIMRMVFVGLQSDYDAGKKAG